MFLGHRTSAPFPASRYRSPGHSRQCSPGSDNYGDQAAWPRHSRTSEFRCRNGFCGQLTPVAESRSIPETICLDRNQELNILVSGDAKEAATECQRASA